MTSEVKVRDSENFSLKILEQICNSVNKRSLKNVESYKQAEAFLRRIGFKYCEVNYEGTYSYEGHLIDVYSYLQGRVIIYTMDNVVLGCKVRNSPYLFKGHMQSSLNEFSVLETRDSTVYERII